MNIYINTVSLMSESHSVNPKAGPYGLSWEKDGTYYLLGTGCDPTTQEESPLLAHGDTPEEAEDMLRRMMYIYWMVRDDKDIR